MKRISNLFDKISDFENIVLAAYKAFRNKTSSEEVIRFRSDFYYNINEIRQEILNNEIQFGNYNEFVIYEPKKRLICAAPLKQRIVHHAIMNVCHPFFDRNLIYDSYASRKDKGVHKAVLRTQELAKPNRYYVKLDFCKYFDSISHDLLSIRLNRLFKDEDLLNLLNRIINSYGKYGRGLPIGNLTSQYFANFYLSDLDHYMKEDLKCRAYIRYMDDVIIMAEKREDVTNLSKLYCIYAQSKLSLTVKPPLIGRISNGIPFLGYRIYKSRVFIGGKSKRRFNRNLTLLNNLFFRNKISEVEYSARLISIISYVKFADSFEFRKRRLNVKELQSRESWRQLEQQCD